MENEENGYEETDDYKQDGEGEYGVEEAPMPIQKKEIPKVDIYKTTEYVGTKNLRQELESLKNRNFDEMSPKEMHRLYDAILVSIDDAVRNNISRIEDVKKTLDTDLNDRSVRGRNWAGDLWFQMYEKQTAILRAFVENSSYMSWEISFMKDLVNKFLTEMLKASDKRETTKLVEKVNEVFETATNHYKQLLFQVQDFYERRILAEVDRMQRPGTGNQVGGAGVTMSMPTAPAEPKKTYSGDASGILEYIKDRGPQSLRQLNAVFRMKGIKDMLAEMESRGGIYLNESDKYDLSEKS